LDSIITVFPAGSVKNGCKDAGYTIYYINTEENIPMAVTVEQDLKEYLAKEFEKIDQRFDQIDQRFEKIDQRFEKIDQRFEKVEQKFEQKFEKLTGDVNRLEQGQIRLEVELKEVKSDLSELKNNQNKQLWYLMWTVIGAVVGTFIKFGFFPNVHF
jgi:flagellar capping protein FliD